MRKLLVVLLLIITVISCKKEIKNTIDVSNIDVTVEVQRFDVDFYSATQETLGAVKEKYPFLFPAQVEDSVWVNKLKNTDEQELFAETLKVFPDFEPETKKLENLFKHIQYYHKAFEVPKVITMLTNIDYDNRVVYADSLLLISLDGYLGANHKFYNDYPEYIKQNNHEAHLVVDVANTFINKQMPPNTQRSFIDKMIFEGKKMYLLDRYLPWISDSEKIGYSEEKWKWAVANEEEIWKYFIDQDLLYSTETKLNKRFLEVAPFSKFYMDEDNLSPGRIGVWLGWQIVRSYMQNNDVSLSQLLQTREADIFKNSKYKPKR